MHTHTHTHIYVYYFYRLLLIYVTEKKNIYANLSQIKLVYI